MQVNQLYGVRHFSYYHKYTNASVDSSSDDVYSLTDIGINNGEQTITQKIYVHYVDLSLERVNSTKFLGIIIDQTLTWKNHIDAISKTISRNIGMLGKLKQYVIGYILYSLYCTLVLPYVSYGDSNLGKYIQSVFRYNFQTAEVGNYDFFT